MIKSLRMNKQWIITPNVNGHALILIITATIMLAASNNHYFAPDIMLIYSLNFENNSLGYVYLYFNVRTYWKSLSSYLNQLAQVLREVRTKKKLEPRSDVRVYVPNHCLLSLPSFILPILSWPQVNSSFWTLWEVSHKVTSQTEFIAL